MTAAQEAMKTCSRCGCAGPLHREDEVERGCQLAVLRTALSEAADVLEAAAANAAGHVSAMPQDPIAYELLRACAQQARAALRVRE